MLFAPADVPLGRDGSGRFLPWLVALMVYLAALALTSALVMNKLAQRWDHGLSGRLTVQVPAPGPNSEAAAATAKSVAEVMTELSITPGVTSAELLDRGEMNRLLEPWLGEGAKDPHLPLPTLIAVTLDRQAPPPLDLLSARLEQVAPGIVVDDHQHWLGNLLNLARTIETIAILVVVAVGGAAMMTVVFVTRTGLAIHQPAIDLLHLIGAQDSYIARQFQNHALRLGLGGGALGLLLAVLTVLLIGYLLGRSQAVLLPDLSLSPLEWLLLILLPLATAAVAMVTARLTVMFNLSRLP